MLKENQVIVVVDAGRDSIKSMVYDKKNYNELLFSSNFVQVDFNYTKNIPVLDFDKDRDIIASVDGNPAIAYGGVCNKLYPPDRIQHVTSDSIYLEYSVNYTLTAIAGLVKDGADIILGINLTADNIDFGDEVVTKLKGKHTVTLHNAGGKELKKVNFTIDKVGVFFQGWVSYLNFAFDKNFNVVEEYAEKDTLMGDWGRKTLDMVFVSHLSPIKNMAYDCGVEKYYIYIREILSRPPYKIRKFTHEIENIINKGKNIKDFEGKPIDLEKVQLQALELLAQDVTNGIKEDFSSYSFEKIVFTGGGTYLFSDLIKSIFKHQEVEIMDEPIWSNTKGLLKLMIRKFDKNMVGT